MAQPPEDNDNNLTVEQWRAFVDNMHYITCCTCCMVALISIMLLRMSRRLDRLDRMYEEMYEPLTADTHRFPEVLTSSPDWLNITEQVKAVQYAVWGSANVHKLHTQIANKHGVQSGFVAQ